MCGFHRYLIGLLVDAQQEHYEQEQQHEGEGGEEPHNGQGET